MLHSGIKEKIIYSLLPFNPAKIILFGSYAYGKPEKDSDIDLIVYTYPLYNKFLSKGSMFSREINQKGIVLYERNYERVA